MRRLNAMFALLVGTSCIRLAYAWLRMGLALGHAGSLLDAWWRIPTDAALPIAQFICLLLFFDASERYADPPRRSSFGDDLLVTFFLPVVNLFRPPMLIRSLVDHLAKRAGAVRSTHAIIWIWWGVWVITIPVKVVLLRRRHSFEVAAFYANDVGLTLEMLAELVLARSIRALALEVEKTEKTRTASAIAEVFS